MLFSGLTRYITNMLDGEPSFLGARKQHYGLRDRVEVLEEQTGQRKTTSSWESESLRMLLEDIRTFNAAQFFDCGAAWCE